MHVYFSCTLLEFWSVAVFGYLWVWGNRIIASNTAEIFDCALRHPLFQISCATGNASAPECLFFEFNSETVCYNYTLSVYNAGNKVQLIDKGGNEIYAWNFEEQLGLLGQYGEVDSNFVKIMNIMKIKEDDSSWAKINFLEKINGKI